MGHDSVFMCYSHAAPTNIEYFQRVHIKVNQNHR